jgi:Mg-chelatase subunit ChlD
MKAWRARSIGLRVALWGAIAIAQLACGADSSAGVRKIGDGTAASGTQPASPSAAGSSFGNAPTATTGDGATAASGPSPNAKGILDSSCATASVQSELLPANLLFVIDRSGSMNCNPPPTTDSMACESNPTRADSAKPSKWEITRDALDAAMRQLPASASVGISYFSNDDSCGVSSTPSVALGALGAQQLAALKASLDSVTPSGGTPLVGATILAYKHLHALALQQKTAGNAFVVLLTDGQQSDQCSDPARCADAIACTDLLLDTEVPKAVGAGADIRTFVIGAPGSEPARAVLSQIALEGGTAPKGCNAMAGECHFDMTRKADFAAALSDALTTITGKAASCELPLPSSSGATLDKSFVNVVYTPGDGSGARVVPQDMRAACDAGAQGWQYSADATRIELCGAICDSVRADKKAHLDVVLGCPAQGPA